MIPRTETTAPLYAGAPASGNDLADFVALSAALTGIDAAKLRPALDTHETAQTYLDLASDKGGATFVAMMAAYSANRTKSPPQIATAVLEQSGAAVAYLARSVMLLWYLASWYDPAELPPLRTAPPGTFVPFTIVSSDAYTQGWVWRVGQTHPMGYSEWAFGYWHDAPQPLTEFIGTGGGSAS
jgi:hypothetical protein